MAASNSSMVLRQRRQRRRRGLLIVTSYVVIVFALAWYFDTQATTTILFVRHADVDDPADLIDGEDPPLNATGRARAQLFADFLEHIDVIASGDAVYAGDTLRARQTAEPLAARHGLTVA